MVWSVCITCTLIFDLLIMKESAVRTYLDHLWCFSGERVCCILGYGNVEGRVPVAVLDVEAAAKANQPLHHTRVALLHCNVQCCGALVSHLVYVTVLLEEGVQRVIPTYIHNVLLQQPPSHFL